VYIYIVLKNIYKDEDDELGNFEKHAKGIGVKLLNKMGYDGKVLDKIGQGINKPIQICVRQKIEGLGYEGQTIIEANKFVKGETLTKCKSSTRNDTTNQMQKQEQLSNNCGGKGRAQAKCWNIHPCNIFSLTSYDHHKCWNKEISNPHVQVQCGLIDVNGWKKVGFMLKIFWVKYSNNNNMSHPDFMSPLVPKRLVVIKERVTRFIS